MKVGDLVIRTNDLVKESLGVGIIIKAEANDKYSLFYQVKWFRAAGALDWYEAPDLELISENR